LQGYLKHETKPTKEKKRVETQLILKKKKKKLIVTCLLFRSGLLTTGWRHSTGFSLTYVLWSSWGIKKSGLVFSKVYYLFIDSTYTISDILFLFLWKGRSPCSYSVDYMDTGWAFEYGGRSTLMCIVPYYCLLWCCCD
jgi:hypothetical protein